MLSEPDPGPNPNDLGTSTSPDRMLRSALNGHPPYISRVSTNNDGPANELTHQERLATFVYLARNTDAARCLSMAPALANNHVQAQFSPIQRWAFHHAHGLVLSGSLKHDDGLAELTTALRLADKHLGHLRQLQTRVSLARVCERQGNIVASIRWLSQISPQTMMSPQERSIVSGQLGRVAFHHGLLTEGLTHLDTALRVDPWLALDLRISLLMTKAIILAELGRADDAAAAIEKANTWRRYQANPALNGTLILSESFLARSRGELPLAIDLAESARSHFAERQSAFEEMYVIRALALTYLQAGSADRALHLLSDERFANMNPTFQQGIETAKAKVNAALGDWKSVATNHNRILEFGDRTARDLSDFHALLSQHEPSSEVLDQYELLRQSNATLEHINREKHELLALVGHDLQSPLTSLRLSFEQMFAEGSCPDHSLKRVKTSIDRLAGLASKLSTVHELELGTPDVDRLPIDLEPVVRSLFHQFGPAAEAKQISLVAQWDRPSEPSVFVLADKTGLFQILDNFLSNAVKYSPRGTTVTVSWTTEMTGSGTSPSQTPTQPDDAHLGIGRSSFDRPDLAPQTPAGEATEHLEKGLLETPLHPGTPEPLSAGTVVIRVKDQGPGLTFEDRRNLFTKYLRLSAKPTAGEASTGLGLYIAHSYATAMNGTVSAHSRGASFGSTFMLRLPSAAGSTAATTNPVRSPKATATSSTGTTSASAWLED